MSSTITIRSRCHEAGGDWRPEPGSPKYMRDLMAAQRRAERPRMVQDEIAPTMKAR